MKIYRRLLHVLCDILRLYPTKSMSEKVELHKGKQALIEALSLDFDRRSPHPPNACQTVECLSSQHKYYLQVLLGRPYIVCNSRSDSIAR